MAKKTYTKISLNVPIPLLKEVDKIQQTNETKIKDRTQLILIALEEFVAKFIAR